MRHKLLTLAAIAFLSLPMMGQGEVVFDFSSSTNYNNCTKACYAYDRDPAWTFSGYGEYPYMYDYQVTEPYYDDYLVTPELELQAGVLYEIQTSAAAYTYGKTAELHIGLGSGDDIENYTEIKVLSEIPYAASSSCEEKTLDFTVETSGTYRLSFRGVGNALSLYKTKIVNMGTSAVPATVTNFYALPTSDYSGATLYFTLPTKTKSGDELSGNLTYRIYRYSENDLVTTGRGTPGMDVSYTDAMPPLGHVTYLVTVSKGEDVGDAASLTTYIGHDCPLPVTNIAVEEIEGGYRVTWDEPVAGENGSTLDYSKLSYQVTQILDGSPGPVSELTPLRTYDDLFEFEGLRTLKYSVVAFHDGAPSQPAESAEIKIGTLPLPFTDSFAEASLGEYWTTEAVNGTTLWKATDTRATQKPNPAPQDGDGGMAYYESWSASSGNSARLITPPFVNEQEISKVVEFWLCHSDNSRNDRVQVEVSRDGGAWTQVDGAVANVTGDQDVWEKFVFNLDNYLYSPCKTYRVSLTAISDYGHNIYIDNVRIFNVVDYDLSVKLSAPESVKVGSDLTLGVTVSNNGSIDIPASDWSVSLSSPFDGKTPTIESVDIPALGSARFEVTIPVTTFEARESEMPVFYASVNGICDTVEDNNSDSAVVAMDYSTGAAPTELTAVTNSDRSITVSWTPAADATKKPVSLGTSFEDYADGATGPFDGFVSIDLDGDTSGGTYYTTSGSEFNVVESPYKPTGLDGTKCIGLTLGAYKQQDDWLISPEIVGSGSDNTLTLSFMIATKTVSTSYYEYTYEVLYATEDYDPASPATAFTHLVASKKSNVYSGDFRPGETMAMQTFEGIPAEAKYIAVHFTTNMSIASALWVDNISVKENVENAFLGYNLYHTSTGRVNEEIIPADATSYLIPAPKGRTDSSGGYFLTAVYSDGESQASNVTMPTGVSALQAGKAAIAVREGGIEMRGMAGETATVSDISGRVMARVNCADKTEIRLPAGIYVVRAGARTAKVIVK